MKLYVIRWLHDYFYRERSFQGGQPECAADSRLIRTFLDPVLAEAYRRALEAGEEVPPVEANPFHSLRQEVDFRLSRSLGELTTFPEPAFADWLRDHGLEPPTPPEVKRQEEMPEAYWADWWDKH